MRLYRYIFCIAIWAFQLITASVDKYLKAVTTNKAVQALILSYLGTSWKFKKHIRFDTGRITSCIASKDGSCLLFCLDTGEIKTYDLVSGYFIQHQISSQMDSVQALFFTSVDEVTWIFQDGSIVIYKTDDSSKLEIIAEYQPRTKSAFQQPFAFNAAVEILASTSHKNSVELWNFTSPDAPTHAKTILQHTGRISHLTFSQCGVYIASGSCDRTVRVWNLAKQKIAHIASTKGPVTAVAWIGCDQFLAYCSTANDCITIWERETGKTASINNYTIGHKLFPVPYTGTVCVGNSNGTISVYSSDFNEPEYFISAHTDPVDFIACSSDGKYMVSGNSKKENGFKLWENMS